MLLFRCDSCGDPQLSELQGKHILLCVKNKQATNEKTEEPNQETIEKAEEHNQATNDETEEEQKQNETMPKGWKKIGIQHNQTVMITIFLTTIT